MWNTTALSSAGLQYGLAQTSLKVTIFFFRKMYTAFEQLFGEIFLSYSTELLSWYLLKIGDPTSSGQEAQFASDSWIFMVYRKCSEQFQPCALQLPEQENVHQLPALLPAAPFTDLGRWTNTRETQKEIMNTFAPQWPWIWTIKWNRKEGKHHFPEFQSRIPKSLP